MANVGPAMNSNPKVVIIGAGIAGLAAGEFLARKGFKDFTILEAMDRTGGRIYTVDIDDRGARGKVEMGANWIHGIERNPIYQIADENHLLQLRNADRSLRHRDLFIMEDGSHVTEKKVKEIDWIYGLLIQQCEEFYQLQIPTPEENDSVGDFLEREYYEKIEKYSNLERKQRELVFSQRLSLECCITGCDNMCDVSLSEIGSYEELPGVHYSIPPGFDSVLEIIKKNIPKDNILTNHPVRCVRWSETDSNDNTPYRVCVECENGEKFYADHVIVTVSLGVLKASSKRMFSPPLPQEKILAINRLGFGIVDKVILEFDEKVVDSDIFRIELLWDVAKDTLPDLRNSWYKKIYSFEVVQENVLIGCLSGKEALYMESLPEEQVAADCVKVLRMFLKKPNIPHPRKIIRTRWGNNPNTRGAYSYVAVGSSVHDIETLAEPLAQPGSAKPEVFFAGEATHTSFYSTTHGALLTGWREAERIVGLYKDDNSSS